MKASCGRQSPEALCFGHSTDTNYHINLTKHIFYKSENDFEVNEKRMVGESFSAVTAIDTALRKSTICADVEARAKASSQLSSI